MVQMGITRILEAIFEVDFLEVSYGFRCNRSCHDALDRLDKAIMTQAGQLHCGGGYQGIL